jgi:predicted dehydrogenase
MNVAIIGCGSLGQKRARNLIGATLIACADTNLIKAQTLAQSYPNCSATDDWQSLLADDAINIFIIATPHIFLSEITHAAVNAGKHVLVEKPAACHPSELTPIITAAKKMKVIVCVGFNHRYHRGIRHAHDLVTQGVIGELMYIRARYGHGGRLGYEREWRADVSLAGGGELIDQGIHLIDLARWFLGDFNQIQGYAPTYFWNMSVEDNGFLLLKTPENKVAFLHASCTEWKNLFSFEIFGRDGKIEINGLGGSYGTERTTYYKMAPTMGPPETFIWEYPMPDDSWQMEFTALLNAINLKQPLQTDLASAQAALAIIHEVYRLSKI